MRFRYLIATLCFGFFLAGGAGFGYADLAEVARARIDDLRWSTYITAGSVRQLAQAEDARTQALALLNSLGVTKVYVEVYRGGTVITRNELVQVRDFFIQHGFPVVGGIATVPGGDFGVAADRGLAWFNFQSEKTQRDLEAVVRTAASVFDTFIVDDFLCSGDKSPESDAARRGRSWSAYRRDLLTALSQRLFIAPAKEVNPAITMIVKYPQWYDLFHRFGYDPERESQLYDQVWVGTETRGARTQRYGFVQPYEGFVNYRWLASIAGAKTGGAWFDHGDCDGQDFIEQAWQTVLAGAPEIVLFNYANLAAGHPGHAFLRQDFERLADLARAIRSHPVRGAGAYKPPNSDAGGDLYLMDYLGMLGIPLVPSATFPHEANAILIPTQAAADAEIQEKVKAALHEGKSVVLTTGFLAALGEVGTDLCRLAGVAGPIRSTPRRLWTIGAGGQRIRLAQGLDIEAALTPTGTNVLLGAFAGSRKIPFLTRCSAGAGRIAVLNTHTFSQADFDAVGEVLLAPRPLGLLDVPATWAQQLRAVFSPKVLLEGPTRVACQPLGPTGCFLQNYNDEAVAVCLRFRSCFSGILVDGFTGAPFDSPGDTYSVKLESRSRLWLKGGSGT